MKNFLLLVLLFILSYSVSFGQQRVIKDSTVLRITYRDTVIYRYDTIRIKHYVHSDTLWKAPEVQVAEPLPKKGWRALNPNNWGIGPSVGAYYSPFNGFDVNIGFGIQYYILAVPSFRNPHMGHRRNRK